MNDLVRGDGCGCGQTEDGRLIFCLPHGSNTIMLATAAIEFLSEKMVNEVLPYPGGAGPARIGWPLDDEARKCDLCGRYIGALETYKSEDGKYYHWVSCPPSPAGPAPLVYDEAVVNFFAGQLWTMPDGRRDTPLVWAEEVFLPTTKGPPETLNGQTRCYNELVKAGLLQPGPEGALALQYWLSAGHLAPGWRQPAPSPAATYRQFAREFIGFNFASEEQITGVPGAK